MQSDRSGKYTLGLMIFGLFASIVLVIGFSIFRAATFERPSQTEVQAPPVLRLTAEDFAAFTGGAEGAAAFTAPPAPGPGRLDRPLRIGVPARGSLAPGMLASSRAPHPKGPARPLAVAWVRLDDRLSRYEALGRGEVDLVWDSLDGLAEELPRLDALGLGARVVLLLGHSRGADALVGRAGADSLRHQTVALAAYSPAHFLFLHRLAHSGLTPEEMAVSRSRAVLTRSATDALEIFADGRASTVGVGEPWLPRDEEGGAPLVRTDTSSTPFLISEVLVAHPALLASAPQTVAELSRRWLAAVEEVRAHPQLARDALVRELGLDPREAERLLATVSLSGAVDQAPFFGGRGATQLDAAQAIWAREGSLRRTVRAAPWLDGRYALGEGPARAGAAP